MTTELFERKGEMYHTTRTDKFFKGIVHPKMKIQSCRSNP